MGRYDAGAKGLSFRVSGWVAVLGCLLLLSSCSDVGSLGVTANTLPATPQWVVTWGAGLENATTTSSNAGGSEESYRFVVVPTTDGTEERVHFSNLLGKEAVTIGAARLSVSVGTGPAVDATRDVPMTFGGSSSVTLAAGGEVVSDPVAVTYTYGEELAVSVYLKGNFGALNQHNAEFQTNFRTTPGAGNTTTDTAGTSFSVTNSAWYLLTGVDVYGSYQGTVALFGSSSIDGHGSNYGNTNSYPTFNTAVAGQIYDRPSDWMARQLRASGYNLGVLNAGAIGDPAGEDANTDAGTAIAGVDRMKHDVLEQAGVKAVVIYFGGIDLRGDCVPATNVETSLTDMVGQAYAAGVRVILATLPPSEYCTSSSATLLPSTANPYQGDLYPGPENPGSTQRRTLNAWIRTTGLTLPGVVAIADFDAAMAYSAHPDFLIPNYVGPDNFHPNGVAYGIQMSAVPMASLLAP